MLSSKGRAGDDLQQSPSGISALSQEVARLCETVHQLSSLQLSCTQELESLKAELRAQKRESVQLDFLKAQLYTQKQELESMFQSRLDELAMSGLARGVAKDGAGPQAAVADPQFGVDSQNHRDDGQDLSFPVKQDSNTGTEANGQEHDVEGKDVQRPYTNEDYAGELGSEYEIQESVWDATLLIGFPVVPLPTSALLTAVSLFNACIQFFVVLIFWMNMTDAGAYSDETLHDLEHWRAWIGHYKGYVDSNTQRSMARQLCAQSMILNFGGLQFQIYGDVEEFLAPNSESALQPIMGGKALSYIAVLCWITLVMDDLNAIKDVSDGIFQLPRGKSQISHCEGDSLSITSYSNTQIMIISLVMLLPRVMITCFLGITGVFYLSWTSNVGDLVLNTTALAFVLDLDELFYNALISTRVKDVLSRLSPLERRPPDWVQGIMIPGLPIVVLVNVAVLIVCMIGAHFSILEPFHERLAQVERTMCGGEQDFIFDVVNDTIVVANTWPVSDQEHTQQVSSLISYIFGQDTLKTVGFGELMGYNK